jgi:hypothetical protein
MDKETKNRLQRERRQRTNNSVTKKYEKTINGFLMRLYRNMKSRIGGVQKQKYHLYEGKELLSRDEFYEWAKSNATFLKLFHEYKNNDFNRKLAPSVDRIDSSKGYEISNMEFVTHSENSRRGSLNKWKCYGESRPPSTL